MYINVVLNIFIIFYIMYVYINTLGTFTHFSGGRRVALIYDCDYGLIKFIFAVLYYYFFFQSLPPILSRRQLYIEHFLSTCKCVLRAHKTNVYHRQWSLITRPRHNGCRSGRRWLGDGRAGNTMNFGFIKCGLSGDSLPKSIIKSSG